MHFTNCSGSNQGETARKQGRLDLKGVAGLELQQLTAGSKVKWAQNQVESGSISHVFWVIVKIQ